MNESIITPLGDRAVIKKESIEKTKSGLVLPQSTADKSTHIGLVIAIGKGRIGDNGKVVPMSVSKGQKVIFSWGESIEIEGDEYYLVSESSILGVLN